MRIRTYLLAIMGVVALAFPGLAQQQSPLETAPVVQPEAFERPQLGVQLIVSSEFIRARSPRIVLIWLSGLSVSEMTTNSSLTSK